MVASSNRPQTHHVHAGPRVGARAGARSGTAVGRRALESAIGGVVRHAGEVTRPSAEGHSLSTGRSFGPPDWARMVNRADLYGIRNSGRLIKSHTLFGRKRNPPKPSPATAGDSSASG